MSVSLNEPAAADPKITAPLANWRSVTEFSICPSGEAVKDGQKVKVDGKPWRGPREIHNLRWEGGQYSRPRTVDSVLTPAEHEKAFHDAVKKSLEREKADQEAK